MHFHFYIFFSFVLCCYNLSFSQDKLTDSTSKKQYAIRMELSYKEVLMKRSDGVDLPAIDGFLGLDIGFTDKIVLTSGFQLMSFYRKDGDYDNFFSYQGVTFRPNGHGYEHVSVRDNILYLCNRLTYNWFKYKNILLSGTAELGLGRLVSFHDEGVFYYLNGNWNVPVTNAIHSENYIRKNHIAISIGAQLKYIFNSKYAIGLMPKWIVTNHINKYDAQGFLSVFPTNRSLTLTINYLF